VNNVNRRVRGDFCTLLTASYYQKVLGLLKVFSNFPCKFGDSLQNYMENIWIFDPMKATFPQKSWALAKKA